MSQQLIGLQFDLQIAIKLSINRNMVQSFQELQSIDLFRLSNVIGTRSRWWLRFFRRRSPEDRPKNPKRSQKIPPKESQKIAKNPSVFCEWADEKRRLVPFRWDKKKTIGHWPLTTFGAKTIQIQMKPSESGLHFLDPQIPQGSLKDLSVPKNRLRMPTAAEHFKSEQRNAQSRPNLDMFSRNRLWNVDGIANVLVSSNMKDLDRSKMSSGGSLRWYYEACRSGTAPKPSRFVFSAMEIEWKLHWNGVTSSTAPK